MRNDAEDLHLRLLWLVEHCDLSRAEIAAALGRHPGTISPWFAATDWSLPDAKGLVGLARVCTIRGERVSARWLLHGEGALTETRKKKKEGALVYRGAHMVLAEMEVLLLRMRERLREEELGVTAPKSAASGPEPNAAADRLAETDRVLSKEKKKGRRRQAG